MRKKKKTTIVLPGLFFDNEKWLPAGSYPGFTVFTDVCLAGLLGVSKMRVQTWRMSGIIPAKMQGNFAVYSLNAVLQALIKAGYKVDSNKQSKIL